MTRKPKESLVEDAFSDISGISQSDKLEYVAELAEELRRISALMGCSTLTGILEVAVLEANLQMLIHREVEDALS